MFSPVSKILEKYVAPGDTIILGVSGGPDSVALFDMFQRYAETIPIRIVVAHVNHGLRGKDSDKDEMFVKKMVEGRRSSNIIFRSKKISLKNKSDIENRGRQERRLFFGTLKDNWNAKWISTAHHEDDNIESIILHFLRGAGPSGLVGMEEVKDGFLRPFLTFSKKEILEYCRTRKLKFRNDKTNQENTYSRNFLRNKIFPLLAKINPYFQKTIQRNSAIFRGINTWLEKEAETFLEKNKDQDILFSLRDFQKLPKALKSALIQKSFQKFAHAHYRLPYVQVEAVLKMLNRGIGKKRIGSTKLGFFVLDKGKVSYTCGSGKNEA